MLRDADRRSSPKRRGPSTSAQTISTFHLPTMAFIAFWNFETSTLLGAQESAQA
jgi:hypothetical protein